MGLCSSNKVANGKAEAPEAPANDDEEDVPVKEFGKKGRRKRDSIAYNKEAMEKRLKSNDGKSKAPASMVEVVA
jgi:hypothetical protein